MIKKYLIFLALMVMLQGCAPSQSAIQTAIAQTQNAQSIGETLQTPLLTPIESLTPQIGSIIVRPEDGMTMVYVPEGDFLMGSDNGQLDEQPVHTENLKAYWIDRTEVTNSMYGMCVNAGKCKPPVQSSSVTRTNYYGDVLYDNFPVVFVDWNMASDYCSWVGARLPSEAEWEKASRGTDGRTYPWGEQEPSCSLAN